MTLTEQMEMDAFLEEALATGRIRQSKSPVYAISATSITIVSIFTIPVITTAAISISTTTTTYHYVHHRNHQSCLMKIQTIHLHHCS
jgi:hypothetical protein